MTISSATHKNASPNWWKSPVRLGLVGGLVSVAIALEGMIQAFNTRSIIGGVVAMSQLLLLMTYFGVAYMAVRRSGTAETRVKLASGVLAGLVSAASVVVLLLVGSTVNLGDMFINATPALYALLTFNLELVGGSLVMLALGAISGAAAAGLYLLPSRPRRSIGIGLVVVITFGLLQDLIVTTFAGLKFITGFLYTINGLSIVGAIVLFALTVAVDYFWTSRGAQVRSQISTRRPVRWGLLGVGMILLLLVPSILGLYFSEVFDNVGIYLIMGLGLNIVVGFAGLLDLGYVAFFAIGAYTVGVLTSPDFASHITNSWWLALPFGVLLAMLAGVLLGIPVLRMRGDYLAIVTLGFGEIIRIFAISDFLKPYIGGAQGVNNIAKPAIGPIQIVSPPDFYYLILAGCLLVGFIAYRVKDSRLGRAWMAIREDEDVAQAMGINLVATKLLAFAMGATFGGLSGAIFGSKIGSIYPTSFNLFVSINVLVLIIIGGMGSIPGVVVGAIALVGLPELLREFADFRYLFYGLGLVVMMLTRPEGLWPAASVRRELHEEEPRPGALGEPAGVGPE